MDTVRRTGMRNRVVLSVVVVLALAACGTESLPKLPLGAAGDEPARADAASLWAPAEPLVYRFEGDASVVPDEAPAYELGAPEAAQRNALEEAVGADRLQVADAPGSPWYVGPAPDTPVSSTAVIEACPPCPPEADCLAVACPPDRQPRPADLPSRQEATERARALFAALGLSTEGLEVTDGPVTVNVSLAPTVDGLPTVGYEHSLSFGSKGAIVGGHGYLGRPAELGDYPLIDVEAALDRLETGFSVGPRTLAAEIEADVPEAVFTDVDVVLQLVEGHLVPGYRFSSAEGQGPTVVAVVDRLLEDIAPEPEPIPEPEPGTHSCSGSAAAGALAVDPDSGVAQEPADQPLTVEVCGPAATEVGEEVVFEVTVTDPDAEIIESGCGAPNVAYGDEEGAVIGQCMPACAAPLKAGSPGKLAKTFRHAYSKPGTYTAVFRFQSAFCTKGSSSGEGTHTVVVK